MAALAILPLFVCTLDAAPPNPAAPPFAQLIITNNANGVVSTIASDVDGDGDLDVVAASEFDDTVRWYENNGASMPIFTEHVISASALGAFSVVAMDLDADGDVDVLCASRLDDTIAWFENDGGSPPIFTEHVLTTAAVGAIAVAAADMDGDGDIDMLSGSFLDDTIAWYENDGASPPSFTRRVITSNADVRSIAPADVDGDGDMDVLFTSAADNKVAWLDNDGAAPPGFIERTISTTSNFAFAVAAADMDGDGDIDALSGSFSDDTIAWHENVGGVPPVFISRIITNTAIGARSVFAADVDGDGDMDALSASAIDNTIAWYESDGLAPPTFIRHNISQTALGARSIFAADLDGDGDTDVIGASRDNDTVTYFQSELAPPVWNVTTDSFFPSISDALIMAANGDTIRAADFQFGAIADDVLNFAGKSLTLRARGPLIQRPGAVYTLADMSALEAAPGCPLTIQGELLAPPAGAVTLIADPLIIAEGASLTVSPMASLNIAANAMIEGDVLIDAGATISINGALDAVGALSFLEQDISRDPDGQGPFTPGQGFADGASAVFAADLDDDGDADLLSASANNNTIAWFENDGASPPAFTNHIISASVTSASSVFASDIDGDGDMDVLSAAEGGNTLLWHENIGGAPLMFIDHVVTMSAIRVVSVFAADVDSDGDQDILSASKGDNKIAWYESNGALPPLFTEHIISINALFAKSVYAADVDGDGDMDVLSASFNDDKIAWYENDGAMPPSFTEHIIFTSADGACSVIASDVDSDGDMDVLSASFNDDTIAWYKNDGAMPPNFTPHVITTTADGANSVFVSDMDGDGDADVLSTSFNDDKIAWHVNEPVAGGPPSFTQRVISNTADGALSSFATDVDGDHKIEILSASFNDDKIALYDFVLTSGLTLNSGARLVAQIAISSSSSISMNGATVEVAPQSGGGLLMNPAPGDITGFGDILAHVQSAGGIRPSGAAPSAPGVLTIQGDYSQFIVDAAGVRQPGELFINIAGLASGAGHDALTVSGAANLAGNLFVSFANGFTPQAGDRFTILTAGTIGASAFDAVFLPTLPNDLITGKPLVMRVEYNRNAVGVGDSVELVVGQACPADLNGDGAVGVFDLSQLLGFWNLSGSSADLSGDGTVNVFDLAELIGAWGPCP